MSMHDETVKVWDPFVRVFHWSLITLFGIAWWSGENHDMERHRQAGYAIFALVVFRVFWGFAGGRTARFAQFLKGPGAIAAYLKTHDGETPSDGHNPLGGWSVVALLSVILAITLAGLFAVDVDGIESGPLADWVSFDQGRMASEWHESVFKAALAVIGLHVLAISYYQILNAQNLIGPMITGRRDRAKGETTPDVTWSPVWALAGIGVVGALTWAVMSGFRLAG
ncbi:cytochrome b/b6 domain-containing protein [Novosphingobium sp. PASSN1]|uniref:cytochrome b/b6 domain-containing protein n=1 Tax=Novosphingobium sp. PASSN1 TaxID=2015561 RepID=UPI0025D1577D|nr:cytochrome b/b6 domain-containing protein [Novosphingobium sp. PASSN1]